MIRNAGGDFQHSSAAARRLSFARLAIAAFVFFAVLLDPPQGLRFAWALQLLLTGFLLYSAAIVAGTATAPVLVFRLSAVLHLVDMGWAIAVTSITGGADSPFFILFLFGQLGAGYRWGWRPTLYTTVTAVAVLLVQAALATLWSVGSPVHLYTVLLRVLSLGVGGVLIGLLAEEERHRRKQALAITRIMSRVRVNAGLVASVRAVFEEVMAEFGGSRGLLALEEEGGERIFLWSLEGGDKGLDVRLTEEPRSRHAALTFPVPEVAEVISIRRPRGGRPVETVVLDSAGRRQPGLAVAVQPLLDAPFEWQSAICLPQLSGSGWAGRFFLFDPRAASDRHLRFLQVVVRHAGPALFNVYLQRRLQSRSSVVDRARVSRELHDGVIQTLIALKMEMSVLGREVQAALTAQGRSRFEQVQRTLDDQILDVRDLMQTLKPSSVPPEQFVEHLAESLERFRHRTGIDTRLTCEADHIDLPAATCGQLAAVVQEALANVRKHSGASRLHVSVAPLPAGWQIAIDDDGEGFDFAGRLGGDELERSRLGPVTIREQVKAMGGRLVVASNPGRGARLEITIPGRGRHDGTATDPSAHRRRSSDLPGGTAAPAGSGA